MNVTKQILRIPVTKTGDLVLECWWDRHPKRSWHFAVRIVYYHFARGTPK